MVKSVRVHSVAQRRTARVLGKVLLAVFVGVPAAGALLFFAAAALFSPPSAGAPLAARLHIPYPAIVAHRGLSAWAPEETRPAYLLARAIGADYLEADVQRTRDGVLIALHDETLQRTTNVTTVFPDRRDRGPAAFSWAELQQLDAGAWWNAAHPDRARPSYVGLRILGLEELLELARRPDLPSAPGLYLETKDPEKYPGYERELVALLAAHGFLAAPPPGAAAPLIFQSFDAQSLERLRELAPAVPRVLLVEHKPKPGAAGKKPSWEALLRQAQALGAGLGPSGYEAMPWHTGPAHQAGLLVHPYTINQRWQLRMLRQFGCDGVFTDTADLARAVLGRAEPGYDRERALNAAFQATGY